MLTRNKIQLITLGIALLAKRRADIPGRNGLDGIPGERGFRGVPGGQGERGERGEQGGQGEQGGRGEQGGQGYRGIQGVNGERGGQGEQGCTGVSGSSPIRSELLELINPLIPLPVRGERGDSPSVSSIVKKVLSKLEKPKDGKPPGHEIINNRIRFKKPDGGWGAWIDLAQKNIYITRTLGSTGGGSDWVDGENWVD